MTIVTFIHTHILKAAALALSNYDEERSFVSILSQIEAVPDLTPFADNGLGVAAFDGDKMLGFLCAYSPWENAFTTTARGTFSPIHAHGAIMDNREMIYKRLYQAAAKVWVNTGISSHSIGLYAHDGKAINSFFVNGFGLRCVDAIRSMEEIECAPCIGYNFYELDKSRINEISELRRMLSAHLGSSPSFMMDTPEKIEAWIARAMKRNSRAFVAAKSQEIIAFIEIMNEGENFAAESDDMKSICGAYCLPGHRGKGVYQNLLNFTISTLKAEGYTRLGVDFESFNPTAYGFWLKYFTAYTYSVVRRIDERAIELDR